MADLDELERLMAPRDRSIDDIADDTRAIVDAAPALIAAARERDRLRAAVDGVLADVARWREHTEARARGGQHVGTGGEIGNLSHSTAAYLERVLGHVGGGEPGEVDRLRALCREAAAVASKVPIIVSEPAKGLDCYSCVGCRSKGSRECAPTCWVPQLSETIERLRAAGGGT